MTMFTKDMSILQALEQHPRAREVFESHGMTCCLCIGAQLESVEAGAIMHAVDPDEVVGELNALAGDGLDG
jgi:hybrid cluster-associated redox disulfide protein